MNELPEVRAELAQAERENAKLRAEVERLKDMNDLVASEKFNAQDKARKLALQLGEATSALKYAKDAVASGWAALGDNLESRAAGGQGIEKPYTLEVQAQLRAAEERIGAVLAKIEAGK